MSSICTPMPANSIVRARVDETLKQEAAAVPATMGLTVFDFVRIGLTRGVSEQRLPFEMQVPTVSPRKPRPRASAVKMDTKLEDAQDLFDQLGI